MANHAATEMARSRERSPRSFDGGPDAVLDFGEKCRRLVREVYAKGWCGRLEDSPQIVGAVSCRARPRVLKGSRPDRKRIRDQPSLDYPPELLRYGLADWVDRILSGLFVGLVIRLPACGVRDECRKSI